MILIPDEALPYFENLIYLPMLIAVLHKDAEVIKNSDIKLSNPYLKIMGQALIKVQGELSATHQYAQNNDMQLIKKEIDGNFTVYLLIYKGYESERRYFNIRLRNRTEELLTEYLRGI